MTEQQFIVLAEILSIPTPERDTAYAVMFHNQDATVAAASIIDKLRQSG